MAWNQPNNKGTDRDPWGSNSGNRGEKPTPENRNNRPPKKNNSSPFNIDEIMHKVVKYLKGNQDPSKNSFQSNKFNEKVIIISLIIATIIWFGSGFYTIAEAERGVITRFGKFSHIVEPGLNWKPTFIDSVTTVNVETTREIAASGVMLTADENVVRVEMNVQYRVTDPVTYLFSVTNANDSLRQATDSAIRAVIGKYPMDKVLTEGRTIVRSDTYAELINTIKLYNMGITIQDVNFQAARPPEEVQAAFNDAIAARENEQQYIRQAEAYANEKQPKANGQAQRLLENARAYKSKIVLEAQGEVARFNLILPQYKAAPEITRERLYLESMERLLASSKKVLMKNGNNSITLLPLDQLFSKTNSNIPNENANGTENNRALASSEIITPQQAKDTKSNPSKEPGNMIDQRRLNVERSSNRVGRG